MQQFTYRTRTDMRILRLGQQENRFNAGQRPINVGNCLFIFKVMIPCFSDLRHWQKSRQTILPAYGPRAAGACQPRHDAIRPAPERQPRPEDRAGELRAGHHPCRPCPLQDHRGRGPGAGHQPALSGTQDSPLLPRRELSNIFRLKRFALQTIRPGVSRKKRDFSAWFGPGGAVPPPRILPFSKAKYSMQKRMHPIHQ